MAKATHVSEARSFSERLRRALDAAGVRPSPTLVANEFNLRYWGKSITPHTARSWLVGKSIPMQDKLRVLSQWLHVSPDELRFGVASGRHGASEPGAEPYGAGAHDREMWARYLALPEEDRKMVRAMVMALAATIRARRPHTRSRS